MSGFESLTMVGLTLLVVIALLTSLLLLLPQGGNPKEANMENDDARNRVLGRMEMWTISIVETLKEVSIGAAGATVSS